MSQVPATLPQTPLQIAQAALGRAFDAALLEMLDPVTKRYGPWFTTFSGKAFHSFDPRPEDCDILDAAHHITGQNRWRGACSRRQRTALHAIGGSFVIEAITKDKMMAYAYLHHDDDECYLVDWPSPFKQAFPFFRGIEEKLAVCIYQANNIPLSYLDHPTMKEFDKRFAQDEYLESLLPPALPILKPRPATGAGSFDNQWSDLVVEQTYLHRHFDLAIELGLRTKADATATFDRLRDIYARIANRTEEDMLQFARNGVLPMPNDRTENEAVMLGRVRFDDFMAATQRLVEDIGSAARAIPAEQLQPAAE